MKVSFPVINKEWNHQLMIQEKNLIIMRKKEVHVSISYRNN
jgi:hypothetical protein